MGVLKIKTEDGIKVIGGGGGFVEVDATLSVEGKAADSSAVGTALADKQPLVRVQAEEPVGDPIGSFWYDTDDTAISDVSGGSDKKPYEYLIKVEEAVESVEFDFIDENGEVILLEEIEIVQHFISTNVSGADTSVKLLYEDNSTGYVMIANNYANAAGNWIHAVSLAKVYGKTLYALSNKNANQSASTTYQGGFTKQGVVNVNGWGTEWCTQSAQPIKGIIGMKVPGAVGAKGQFYIYGVRV
jgi:hypothetical protein